jgi:hypothetical protein
MERRRGAEPPAEITDQPNTVAVKLLDSPIDPTCPGDLRQRRLELSHRGFHLIQFPVEPQGQGRLFRKLLFEQLRAGCPFVNLVLELLNRIRFLFELFLSVRKLSHGCFQLLMQLGMAAIALLLHLARCGCRIG